MGAAGLGGKCWHIYEADTHAGACLDEVAIELAHLSIKIGLLNP